MVVVENVSKQFYDAGNKIQVLNNLSFKLTQGSSVALMGQSGAGKSTLLHVLGGFEAVDAGSIAIDGQELTAMEDNELSQFRRLHLGMVFQQFNLIESLNVIDNITFVRRLNRLPAIDDETSQLIKVLRLEQRLRHFPYQLSGGEQQRVAIARALAAKPSLLLADEPTGSLDEKTADIVMAQLVEVVELQQTTLLLVTHSAETAAYLQQCWRLEKGALHC